MLNLKLFELFGDLILKTNRFDATMKKVQSQLSSIKDKDITFTFKEVGINPILAKMQALRMAAQAPITLNISVQGQNVAAALAAIKKGIGPSVILITGDPRPFKFAANAVANEIQQLKAMAIIPIHAGNYSILLTQLRDIEARLKRMRALGNLRVRANNGGGVGGMGDSHPGMQFGGGFAQGIGIPVGGTPAQMAGQMAGQALAASVGYAISLEAKMAEVRRITNLTAEGTATLKENLKAASVAIANVSLEDLVDIAGIGGRMGMQGTEQITQFTKDIAMVKNAIGDVGTEDLANGIGRVLNVFGLGTEYIRGFGSALTAMDNVSTATASDILAITQGLSGTAQAIGLTLPQVTALASVLKDVGLSNAVASSSFSQIFRKMASDSAGFAQKIGVDAKTFADAYRRDPMEALGMVIEKFKSFGDTIEQQEFLDELGLKGVRTAGSLQQLASKFDEVAKRAKMAADETGNLNSLTSAYNTKAETTETGITKLKNEFINLGEAISSKTLPAINAAAQGIALLINDISHPIDTATGIFNAIPHPVDAGLSVFNALSNPDKAGQNINDWVSSKFGDKEAQKRLDAQDPSKPAANPDGKDRGSREMKPPKALPDKKVPETDAEAGMRKFNEFKAKADKAQAQKAKENEFAAKHPIWASLSPEGIKNKMGALGQIASITQNNVAGQMPGLKDVLKNMLPDQSKPRTFTSGMDFDKQLQDQILNSDLQKKMVDNQTKANEILVDIKTALTNGLSAAAGIVLKGPE